MISLKKLSMLAIALVIGVVMMGCKEGPAGPSGSATCGICHSSKADVVNSAKSLYELSKHNTGIVYEEEGGNLSCAACHSGTGYAEAADAGVDNPTAHASGPINCQACHPIHTDYAMTDFSLRQKAGFNLRIGGAAVDFKNSNTCGRCHQGRTYALPAGDTTIKVGATSTTTYTRFGPHYGTPANVFTMNGPYAIAGSLPVPTTNIHGNLSKGCITCHMGSIPAAPTVGGHSFLIPAASFAKGVPEECKTCHTDPTNQFKTLALAADVKKDLAEYKQILITKGLLDLSQTTAEDGSYQILGEYLAASKTGVFYKADDLKAVLNYLYLAKDRSYGAHNPTYVKALLKNGLEYLKK